MQTVRRPNRLTVWRRVHFGTSRSTRIVWCDGSCRVCGLSTRETLDKTVTCEVVLEAARRRTPGSLGGVVESTSVSVSCRFRYLPYALESMHGITWGSLLLRMNSAESSSDHFAAAGGHRHSQTDAARGRPHNTSNQRSTRLCFISLVAAARSWPDLLRRCA